MQRRNVLRILGGGVVAAATAPLAGCSTALPPAAIAAWQGPGNETDVRRWILGHAILAPHAHNLQSWVVDLGTPGEITLYCDLQRLLPQTDPYARQVMMSHGTFLELLDLAARERGLRAEFTLFPQGSFGPLAPDTRPVARIRLLPDPGVARDPLFRQILARHTNRNAYDPSRPVPAAAWAAMAEAATGASLRFGHTTGDEALPAHRAIAAQAWAIELGTPRTLLESLQLLRVGATEVAAHRDGLVLMDPKVVWAARLGLFDRSRAPAPGDRAIAAQIEGFGHKLASTPGFLWLVSEGNTRETQLQAGRAYARVQLAATAHGVALQPLQQALQEYPEQAQPHAAVRRLLDAPAPTHTVQMWARAGFAAPVDPAPRRALDAFIRRA